MELAQNIRWIRLLSGKTQDEFAKIVGSNRAAYVTYETGRTIPNELILSKIAAIAGINIQQLESVDLKTLNINVVNPDTKQMEYVLTPGSETIEVKELKERLSDLEKEAQKLQAENNLLKELMSSQLEKR